MDLRLGLVPLVVSNVLNGHTDPAGDISLKEHEVIRSRIRESGAVLFDCECHDTQRFSVDPPSSTASSTACSALLTRSYTWLADSLTVELSQSRN